MMKVGLKSTRVTLEQGQIVGTVDSIWSTITINAMTARWEYATLVDITELEYFDFLNFWSVDYL